MQNLPQRLSAALSASASSRRATAAQTPALSYGRHRGPAPADVRRAAVAVVWLRRVDGSWWLPLTLRPHNLRHHGGQVCLPGGMIEAGETSPQAALREFQEELGQLPVDPLMCGELEPLYVYGSNNLIFPVIFTATAPTARWNPDPLEVESILEMPLAMLLAPLACTTQTRSRQILRDGHRVGAYRFQSTAYNLDGQTIWGATAMLLSQLAQLIGGETVAAVLLPEQKSATTQHQRQAQRAGAMPDQATGLGTGINESRQAPTGRT